MALCKALSTRVCPSRFTSEMVFVIVRFPFSVPPATLRARAEYRGDVRSRVEESSEQSERVFGVANVVVSQTSH